LFIRAFAAKKKEHKLPINKKSQIRINCLLRLMKENRYPNYPILLKEMCRLDEAGAYRISQKTIQRDVAYLKNEFKAPIKYDAERKGYYLTNIEWTNMPVVEEAEMNAAILGAHLAETILPPSQLNRNIRQSVDTLLNENYGDMDEAMILRSLVTNGSRVKINEAIFQTVFDAWMQHHSLQIRYRRVDDGRILDLHVEPHVLTLYDNVWYIKARLLKTGDLNHETSPFLVLALHRIIGALPQIGSFEPDIKIIDEVNAGNLFDLPRLTEVKLRVTGSAIGYGTESLPITEQEQQTDGSIILTLQGIEEYRILNFVLTSGGNATIISPTSLAKDAIKMANNFIKNQP
jgi:predicted DNA-binding transcriptional regulator YafY